ncbi:LytR/AlgR family response regulator transcription factor [Larkinella sp. VNQ87]|uniref:LytR/AlgR family response regulator transcription factor n=1 Tax=Larkinella sp. VNQ87 TaxID=3400921 RepID=UPI003C11587F
MWQFFRQPYPCEESVRSRWVKAFWIGVFVGLFLLIFQPFDLSSWDTPNKTVKILGFGLISFLVTAFINLTTPRIFAKYFTNERWTVGREILWISAHITLIGVVNYLYLDWLIGNPRYSPNLPAIIIVTFVIGLFPSAASVALNYIIQLKKYSQTASQLPISGHPEKPRETAPAQPLLTLTAENEKDSLSLRPADLLYIESSDNYSTVVHLNENQPVKTLLRSSLSRLENQFGATAPTIVRCHRSYIVNLEKVEKVTGNAQGYKLHLHGGLFQVPVARKYNDTLVAQLKSLA